MNRLAGSNPAPSATYVNTRNFTHGYVKKRRTMPRLNPSRW
jgi:hypothetical protein